jgi:hypothetical protein
MQIAPGTVGPRQLADRIRPKLLAIKVSGCHLVPVILPIGVHSDGQVTVG